MKEDKKHKRAKELKRKKNLNKNNIKAGLSSGLTDKSTGRNLLIIFFVLMAVSAAFLIMNAGAK